VELKLVERRLFRRVRMLEKCCRTARYCKQTGPSNRISTEKTHAVSRFRIGGSDLRYTASHLKHRALQSTAETAIPDQPSCSPCQTDVSSSFLPAHRGRTGRVGRAEYRDSDPGRPRRPTGSSGSRNLPIPSRFSSRPGAPSWPTRWPSPGFRRWTDECWNSSRTSKLKKETLIARATNSGPVTIQPRHLVE
jgi:hypothetical protein